MPNNNDGFIFTTIIEETNMSGYSSIWVEINKPEHDLPLLQENYNPDAVLAEGSVFACAIKDADEEVPTDIMEELSQQFGAAVYMCVQTTVDFFIYSYWRDGLLVREIQYSADGGWYALDGEAQPWELRLFDEAEKLRQLSYLDLERLAAHSASAQEYALAQTRAAQIEAVWTARALQQDSFYPMATASELYEIVMQEMRLVNPYN
jgi:hypothetical protein